MNSTTGAEATALSIAARVSVERKRAVREGNCDRGVARGRKPWEAMQREDRRKAFYVSIALFKSRVYSLPVEIWFSKTF